MLTLPIKRTVLDGKGTNYITTEELCYNHSSNYLELAAANNSISQQLNTLCGEICGLNLGKSCPPPLKKKILRNLNSTTHYYSEASR